MLESFDGDFTALSAGLFADHVLGNDIETGLLNADEDTIQWSLNVDPDISAVQEEQQHDFHSMISAQFRQFIPVFRSENLDNLHVKSKFAVEELESLHRRLAAHDPSYQETFNKENATAVFSPDSIVRFAVPYFQFSHNYVSLIHRPSFGLADTSIQLLLAVTLAGSMRSPPRDDTLSVRKYARILEEYMFARLAQLSAIADIDLTEARELLETLQAALLVYHLQFMATNVICRRRIRAHRLPVLVSVVRQLGLFGIRHDCDADYAKFVCRESCIRIAHWVAMADWHNCEMFHLPPLVTVSEMTGDMPCTLSLWNTCYTPGFKIRAMHRSKNQARSISRLVGTLMHSGDYDAEVASHSHLSMSDMQLLVLGLISSIISAQLTNTLSTSTAVLRRALERWHELWLVCTSTIDTEIISTTGIERYSEEQCWVANHLLEPAQPGRLLSSYFGKVGHESVVEFHDFLQQTLVEKAGGN